MKYYDYHEIDELPRGEWIECSDGLPPPGKEVIVETAKGKVTALARFIDYEGAPPERGRWDNQYPGKGNCHLMDSIIRWQPMPHSKTPNAG